MINLLVGRVGLELSQLQIGKRYIVSEVACKLKFENLAITGVLLIPE